MTSINKNQHAAFERLCGLVGLWTEIDGTTTVEYRMSAHDSILVETWTWPPKNMEALTIYHLDEDKLIATHYCPIGNQPRLDYSPCPIEGRLLFEFASATNLPDKRVDHCEAFWIEIDDDNRITRSETYEEYGVRETMEKSYERAAI